MSALVSVIVPVYNTEKYLEKCINSILAQTFSDFELLLVDDGSTDASGSIIDEYAKNDSRIRVFHKENGGSSSARNLAIKEAKGMYLSFIDSDDYVEPDFLAALTKPLLDALEKGKFLPPIVQVGRDEIDENGNRLADICVPPAEAMFIDAKAFFTDLIMHVGDCSFCTKITAKSLLDGRAFPEGKLNEDFHLLIQLLLEADGVLSLPGYKYHVFYRTGSNSRKTKKNEFSRVFKDNIENADFVEKIVGEHYVDLKPVAARFGLFQRMDYMLHIPIDFMRNDYEGYPECVSYIRKHWPGFWFNSFLTGKNKLYLSLFALCPKLTRVIHARLKGKRI